MRKLLEQLKRGKILLADGAMGTAMHKRGMKTGDCPEQWNLTHPRDVLAIIQSYVQAGSDLVETNSFGGTSFKLEHYGLQDQVAQINTAAAKIARQAAGDDHFVIGSVGPTGQFLAPLGTVTQEQMLKAFTDQVIALEKGGADAVCVETMTALEEAALAVQAVKENTKLPVITTFTFDKTAQAGYRTMMGVSPARMATEMIKAGADIVGSNCGTGPEDMLCIAREIRENTDAFVMIQANAGMPVLKDGKTIFKATPEDMAQYARKLLEIGVNIIGGCCGTGPEHITAMRKVIP